MIQEYVEAKYGFKVHTAYIAEVKRGLGLPMYDAPNALEELKHPRKHPTAEKVGAIKDALNYFETLLTYKRRNNILFVNIIIQPYKIYLNSDIIIDLS